MPRRFRSWNCSTCEATSHPDPSATRLGFCDSDVELASSMLARPTAARSPCVSVARRSAGSAKPTRDSTCGRSPDRPRSHRPIRNQLSSGSAHRRLSMRILRVVIAGPVRRHDVHGRDSVGRIGLPATQVAPSVKGAGPGSNSLHGRGHLCRRDGARGAAYFRRDRVHRLPLLAGTAAATNLTRSRSLWRARSGKGPAFHTKSAR